MDPLQVDLFRHGQAVLDQLADELGYLARLFGAPRRP